MANRLALAFLWLALPATAAAQAPQPLQLIFMNMGNAKEPAVRKEAIRQTDPKVFPVFRSNPPKVPAIEVFEGKFTPASEDTKLAIFSDDGCDVFIEEAKGKKDPAFKTPIHNRFKKPQHLPSLNESFYVLTLVDAKGKPIPWEKDAVYHIQVRYSNIIHTDRTDVDGCTLFAFQGGGKIGK